MGTDPAFARRNKRIRCDVSMFNSSMGSSNAMVISAGRLSPRSNFSACARTRPKNSSTLPVLTWTLFLLIFDPPQFMYFADESFDDIGRKFDCFYFSHKVSVV